MLRGAWLFGAAMLLAGTACNHQSARRAAPAAVIGSEASNTMLLNVKLRDGFNNSAVSIRVDGVEVYSKSAVSTDLTISFADKVDVQIRKPRVSVEVSVAGGPTGSVQVDSSETPFVDVAIVDGKMSLRTSKTEMPML